MNRIEDVWIVGCDNLETFLLRRPEILTIALRLATQHQTTPEEAKVISTVLQRQARLNHNRETWME